MGLFDFGRQEINTSNDDDTKTQELIQSLKDKIELLEHQNHVLEGQNNAYAYTSRTQHDRIEELEAMLGLEGTAQAGNPREVEELRRAVEEKTAEVERLRQVVDSKAEQIAKMQKESSASDASLVQKAKSLEWLLMERDSQIKSLEKELEALKTENGKYKEFIPRAQTALGNLKKENEALKKALSETNLRCEELEDKLQDQGSVADLQAEIVKLTATITSLERELEERSAEKEAIQEKLDATEARIDHYETAMSSVSAILNKF